MAKLPKAELLQPFFLAAGETEAAQRDWDVPAGLVSQAVEEVTSAGRVASSGTEAAIAAIASDFATDRSIEPHWGEPGRHKQLLKELRDGGDVLVILDALAREYVIELSKYLHPCDAACFSIQSGSPPMSSPVCAGPRPGSCWTINRRPVAGRI